MRRAAVSRVPGGSVDETDGVERCARLVGVARLASEAAISTRAEARRAHAEFRAISLPYRSALARRAQARREARAAAEAAREALADSQSALRGAYRAWRLAHPGATGAEHEQFFDAVGAKAGLPGRQVFRLAGYRPAARASEDLWEDYRLSQAGWTEREIARFRSIHPSAVHKGIVRCAAMEKASLLPS